MVELVLVFLRSPDWLLVLKDIFSRSDVGCTFFFSHYFGCITNFIWSCLLVCLAFLIEYSTWDTDELKIHIFFSFIFISWRPVTLQYCSGLCHTLTQISHGFTCIPHPDPPSHLPLYPITFLRQDRKNLNIKLALCPLASCLPLSVHCASMLCTNQASPVIELPAQS